MPKSHLAVLSVVALVLVGAMPAHAIFGIGGNWSLDLTTKSDDAIGEAVVFDSLSVDMTPFSGGLSGLPVTFQTTISGSDVPIIVDRLNFKSTPLGVGGKLYIDIIPVLDAIEVSGSFYAFTYESMLAFPDPSQPFTMKTDLSQADPTDFKTYVDVNYDSVQIGTDAFGGDTVMPFAKLQFDATVRKTLIGLPPLVNVLKIYAGAGPSIIFSTPIISGGMIYDALGTRIDQVTSLQGLANLFQDPAVQTEIAEYALKQLMTPHMGFHLVAGAQIKPPIIPLALYADMKYTLAGKLDENVDVSGSSFTVQLGGALAF